MTLATTHPQALSTLRTDLQTAVAFAAEGRSPATRRAYKGCWSRFEAYCAGHGKQALPGSPNMVAAFLARLASDGKSWSTVTQHRAAIALAHRLQGLADPTDAPEVALTVDGIARAVGVAPRKQARPLAPDEAKQMLALCDTSPTGTRDRALLAVWYTGAFRRSELGALTLADLVWHDRGVIVHVRRSKGDQHGKGQMVALPASTSETHLRPWFSMVQRHATGLGRQPASQPLFFCIRSGAALSAGACAEIVKRLAAAAGCKPITGHSLRAGPITAAARKGVGLVVLQQTSRHRRLDTLALYVRESDILANIATEGLL